MDKSSYIICGVINGDSEHCKPEWCDKCSFKLPRVEEATKQAFSSLSATPDEALLLSDKEINLLKEPCLEDKPCPFNIADLPSNPEEDIDHECILCNQQTVAKAQLAKVSAINAARVELAKQEAYKDAVSLLNSVISGKDIALTDSETLREMWKAETLKLREQLKAHGDICFQAGRQEVIEKIKNAKNPYQNIIDSQMLSPAPTPYDKLPEEYKIRFLFDAEGFETCRKQLLEG